MNTPPVGSPIDHRTRQLRVVIISSRQELRTSDVVCDRDHQAATVACGNRLGEESLADWNHATSRNTDTVKHNQVPHAISFRAKPTDQGWTVCGSCSIRGRFYVFIVVRHGTAKLHLRNDNNPKTPARLTKPQDSKQITLNCRNHPAANMNLAGQSHHTRAQPH